MATAAREEKQKQPYEGLGAGGKFRKTPFRRTTQATPYDRPSTALRNPSTANAGWISKLVDPAQRLITYSAHRLFSTVFNKRLPPPSTGSAFALAFQIELIILIMASLGSTWKFINVLYKVLEIVI